MTTAFTKLTKTQMNYFAKRVESIAEAGVRRLREEYSRKENDLTTAEMAEKEKANGWRPVRPAWDEVKKDLKAGRYTIDASSASQSRYSGNYDSPGVVLVEAKPDCLAAFLVKQNQHAEEVAKITEKYADMKKPLWAHVEKRREEIKKKQQELLDQLYLGDASKAMQLIESFTNLCNQ